MHKYIHFVSLGLCKEYQNCNNKKTSKMVQNLQITKITCAKMPTFTASHSLHCSHFPISNPFSDIRLINVKTLKIIPFMQSTNSFTHFEACVD